LDSRDINHTDFLYLILCWDELFNKKKT